MFDVRLTYPMGDDFGDRDEAVYAAAGSVSDWAGAGTWDGASRDHGWHAPTFEDATALKQRLETVSGVNVTIREASRCG
jgi:hypothetical protein